MFERVIEQSTNSILITEASLDEPKIVYANQSFLDMSGYDLNFLMGNTPKLFQGEKSNKDISKLIRDNLSKGESISFETINYKKDGDEYNVKINIFPIRDENGVIINYCAVQEDISDKIDTIKYFQKFIDLQDNIVILTDGKTLQFANKGMFDFFGYGNLEEFLEYHECICEKFIEDDRFFSLKKIKDDENWVEVIRTMPHSQRIVTMLRYDFNIHAFSITINDFDDNTSIVTFTNISQTVLNQIDLHKKTIHDKLTGAFNREYFEQNYNVLINEYYKKNLKFALAIFDIDHFKSVNDTYGHDVGDSVLVQMVEVVNRFSRDEDYFIRWGGEEFIMVLGVKSQDSLNNILENIRESIEQFSFDTVGNVTCSIGSSLYKDLEDIESTIKRADDALYYSKRTGRNRVTIN